MLKPVIAFVVVIVVLLVVIAAIGGWVGPWELMIILLLAVGTDAWSRRQA